LDQSLYGNDKQLMWGDSIMVAPVLDKVSLLLHDYRRGVDKKSTVTNISLLYTLMLAACFINFINQGSKKRL